MKKDNRGLSLVELLVAIAIAAIISGSITYLIRTSLHLYGNETADVALQQELQVTLNQIMDYAMESQELVISGDESATYYVALGKIVKDTEKDDDTPAEPDKLDAQIIWREDDKLYLKKELIENINEKAKDETLPAAIDDIISSASSEKDNYLLSEYVSNFLVSPSGIISETTKYENPLSINITLGFSKRGSSKDITKSVSDKAVLRNKIKLPIFVNGTKYTLKKESSKLEVVTENIETEKAFYGDIHYTDSEMNTAKDKVTVIEVIPKPSLSLLGYLVGGKEPIGEDGMDACVNTRVGKNASPQWGCGAPGNINSNGQLLTNDKSGGASIPNFYIRTGATFNGYFEKVNGSARNGRGGVYAIDKSIESIINENENLVNSEKKLLDVGKITFVSEYSDYYSGTIVYSNNDFCWLWREDDTISTEGFYNSSTGVFQEEFDPKDIMNANDGSKIYIKDCKKNSIINNEMFILYCMGQDMSNGTHGLCDGVSWDGTVEYNWDNNKQIKKIDKNQIRLLSYTPEDLKNHESELKSADLIFFLSEESGIYNQAANLLSVEEPNRVDTTTNFYYTNDISFENMKYIYNKVVNYRLGIVVSRPTWQYVMKEVDATVNQSKSENRPWDNKIEPKFKNMNNLFFMLYGMDNKKIVYSNERVYGEEEGNRYYITDTKKVSDLSGDYTAYHWSGRVMFTDFFTSNFSASDKSAFSYVNQVEKKQFPKSTGTSWDPLHRDHINTSDLLHFVETSCNHVDADGGSIGDISLGPCCWYDNQSWWRNLYKKIKDEIINGNGEDYSAVKDRKYGLSDDGNYEIRLKFLMKYYSDLGFTPNTNNNPGVFANQALIESNGQMVKFNPYDVSSINTLGSVLASTNGVMANHIVEKDPIGTIELVGYAVGDGTVEKGRVGLPDNHRNMTYEQCLAEGMHYQHEFENLSDNKGKGLYLSLEEFRQATVGDMGVYVYILVKSSKDLYPNLINDNELENENEYNPYVYYDPKQGVNPLPCEIWSNRGWNNMPPEPGEAIRYKGGTEDNERYVVEFRAHIPGSYFNGEVNDFKPPVNKGNNKLVAQIGKKDFWTTFPKTTEIEGSEIFYIVIRDLFDLD